MILRFLIHAFPLWVLLASLLALVEPRLFTWLHGPFITMGLGVIMLGMGLTLEVKDFAEVLRRPARVFLGVALQYTVMPLLGWGLGYVFDLPTPFAVGLVLVASCPGGTASNVITFLARADVALSVAMTAVSTFLAVVMTPLLTTFLVGNRVAVDTVGLFLSAFQVVILPVTAGLFLHRYVPRLTARLIPWAPLVAVVVITLIVGSIMGSGRQTLLESGARVVAAVFSLHAGGFFIGYFLSRFWVKNVVVARTLSIEVGMQNSGLGVVLARRHFADPLTAIPSAISSVFHSLMGSLLAAFWRSAVEKEEERKK